MPFGEKQDSPVTCVYSSLMSKLSGCSCRPQGVDEERESWPPSGCSSCSGAKMVMEAGGWKEGADERLSCSHVALGEASGVSRWRAQPPGPSALSFQGPAGGDLGHTWPPWAPEPGSAEGAGAGLPLGSLRAKCERVLALDTSFIFLVDLKHVGTKNATGLCSAETPANG